MFDFLTAESKERKEVWVHTRGLGGWFRTNINLDMPLLTELGDGLLDFYK